MPRETQGEWKEAGAWLPANAAPVLGWAAQMRETVFPGPLTLSKRLRPPRQRQGQQRLAPGSSGWVLTARAGSTRGEAEDEPGRGHTAQETARGRGMRKPLPLECWSPKLLHPGGPSPWGLSSPRGADPSLLRGHSTPGKAGTLGDTLDAGLSKATVTFLSAVVLAPPSRGRW